MRIITLRSMIMLTSSLLGVVFLISSKSLSAQAVSGIDFSNPHRIIKNIPTSNDLEVDNEGNVLLLDTEGVRLIKYMVEFQYDSAIIIGGKGTRSEGFLHPVKISALNRQNVYLLDDVQQRVVALNTNLKVIRSTSFLAKGENFDQLSDGNEIFPASFDISPAGELFVLNQQNNKIHKFNSFGEPETTFGGLDFGEGSLYQPVDLRINQNNLVAVSDTADQVLKFYNRYGVYQYTHAPKTGFRWNRFVLFGENLVCFDSRHLYIEHLPSQVSQIIPLTGLPPVIDLEFSKEYLFLLFGNNTVHLYSY